ncbi:MAG TPA: BlaI/MecI/CopY family transcriptional regulator [Mucilaginibacter sp.]|nr:BlaI/MecI/CopY family transcriptional regulator [Mucilaginibacter sp.]
MEDNSLKSKSKVDPSKAELDILTVLWKHGPSTVRFVHNQLALIKEVNYTTTLKQMQIMTEKGMLKRDESNMTHIYNVAEEEQKTKGHLLDKFISNIYNGSAGNLVLQLLDNKKASSKDIEVIRDILNKLEKED